jgi:acyl phosphate:glycerol-3-phosphate acyltransferase
MIGTPIELSGGQFNPIIKSGVTIQCDQLSVIGHIVPAGAAAPASGSIHRLCGTRLRRLSDLLKSGAVDLHAITPPALALLLGYALGSIPFGVLLTRLTGAGDLRKIGSGNIGATNVLRTGRKGLAAATLLLDMAKGTAALVLADRLLPGSVQLAAIGAMLGHLWPVWLKFEGGKGVATYFGIVLGFTLADGLGWPAPAAYAAAWILALLLTRYSSLGGLAAALIVPPAVALLGRFDLALVFLGFTLLVFWKHRANIRRLLDGTEPRVGAGGRG